MKFLGIVSLLNTVAITVATTASGAPPITNLNHAHDMEKKVVQEGYE